MVSANSEKSLHRRIEDIEGYLAEKPESLADLAFTLGERREHLSHKAFMLASENQSGSFNVSSSESERPEVVFVFTGQGAQWLAMGKTLLEIFPIFRESIERLDQALQLLEQPEWTLKGIPTYSMETC